MSLSHDVPLAASLGHCLYVLGNIQRTGEKLLLQYDTKHGNTEREPLDPPKAWLWSLSLDSWSELLPTLTRAGADLPALYFLGATDRLLVIGGNNSESAVTSFCLQSHRWGQVLCFQGRYQLSTPNISLPPPLSFLQVCTAEKVALAGQGTIVGDQVLLMPSIEHNAIIRMDLRTLSTRDLPPLPITTRYEAVFHLYF